MADDAPLSPEQVASPLPGILSRARVVVTPYPFNVSGADRLRVVSANAVAGRVVEIHGRAVGPDFVDAPFRFVHTPNSDRSVKAEDFVVGPGIVTNLTVFATSGAGLLGQTYVSIQLIRSQGATAFVMGTLVAGLVTTSQALGWPGSPIVSSLEAEPAVRTIIGTRPGAGGNISETVPAGARWELLGLAALFATDATVATRAAYLSFSTGGVPIGSTWNPHGAGASASVVYSWLQNVQMQDPFPGAGLGTGPLPTLELLAGQVFSTFVVNEQPGDQWDFPYYTVREWLEVP